MNLNYSDYVEISTNLTENKVYMLVDSQADICVLKQSSFNGNYEIDTSDIIEVTGVVKKPIYSLGSIQAQIFLNGLTITHTFHIMPSEFNIPSDGIIGKDFAKLYNCILDYGENTFTVRTKYGNVILPMKLHTRDNEIVVPPRAEIFKIFRISTTNPVLVKAKELKHGVLTANSIAKDGVAQIRIVNTTSMAQTIEQPTFETDDLSNFHIYTVNKENKNKIRTENLMKILTKSFPNENKLKKKLNELCEEYADIFALETDTMTTNNFYEQELRVTDREPIYRKNYRTPHTQKIEINRQVTNLLKNDLIEPSRAIYNSPIILVPKKGSNVEKKWRMCIDYRAINKKLIPDKFPLPRIDEILDNLGKAKYFSVIDLYSGFHQVPLEQNSRDITTFSTEQGSFRWKVLPFGLNVSPNSFARMMSIAFSGLPPDRAFLYIDDIIVVGKSENHHLVNLKSVFEVLRKYNLKINPEKCKFFQAEVTFLGHKCTSEGILPDNAKLKSIKEWETPHDKDSVRRFVAFANYYRKFIPKFAEISKPLTNLTCKRVDFRWTSEHQIAFEKLKSELISPRILQYPDFEREFFLKVDSSSLGCAGVLLQNHNDTEMPVAYFSKTFEKGEKNKAIIEKELLAIYHSIIAFRPYLYGKHFTVYSDHKPLVYLFAMKNPASKLVRIRLELEEYEFSIIHIPGKDNILADALSRIPFSHIKQLAEVKQQILAITRSMTKRNTQTTPNPTQKITNSNKNSQNLYESLNGYSLKAPRIRTIMEKNELILLVYQAHRKFFEVRTIVNKKLNFESVLLTLQRATIDNNIKEIQWPTDDEIFHHVKGEQFNTICLNTLTNLRVALVKRQKHLTDTNEINKLIEKYHNDALLGGHCGYNKLYAKLRSEFHWKNMTKDIKTYTKNCQQCILNKPRPKTRETMMITPTPTKPFNTVIIDTIGPLQKSVFGNQYAVTIMCDLTKYLVTAAISNNQANTVAQAIFESLILIYGIPKSIRTDSGTEYKNAVFKKLCDLMKIEYDFSSPHHHETVGTIERNHRVFNEYLRAYSYDDTWDVQLKYFSYCYNTSFNASLNHEYTPFELIFGRRATMPEFLNEPTQPIYNVDDHVEIMKHTLELSHEKAKHLIELSKQRNKSIYDRKINPISLEITDKVLLKKEPYNKQNPIFSGPHDIIKILEKDVILDIKGKEIRVHKNRLIKF